MSFIVDTDFDPKLVLNDRLVGQIKDLVAQQLAQQERDFDLQDRYWLLSPYREDPGERVRQGYHSVPMWNKAEKRYTQVAIGSPEWFTLVGGVKKFTYHYDGLSFTVRHETRNSKGKPYSYWRAYATVNGKLVTRQIGQSEKLTPENLDDAGRYFKGISG